MAGNGSSQLSLTGLLLLSHTHYLLHIYNKSAQVSTQPDSGEAESHKGMLTICVHKKIIIGNIIHLKPGIRHRCTPMLRILFVLLDGLYVFGGQPPRDKEFYNLCSGWLLQSQQLYNLVQTKSKSNTSKSMSPSGVNLLNNWHRNDDKQEVVVSTGTTMGKIGSCLLYTSPSPRDS